MAVLKLLSFALCFALAAADTSCNFSAISLAIQDVQVLPGIKDSFMRGISVTAGTPPQELVVLPWAELNNTWLYDYQPDCDSSIIFSDTICRVRRGNFFFENASSTFHKTDDIVAAGGATTESSLKGAEVGISELIDTSLGGSDSYSTGTTSLRNFPIGIPRQNWDHGYTILHAMGMGRDSTYLRSLVDTGQIASRVWSIFWGRMWVDNPLDGQVVLGGYDQAKVLGQNYTQRLDYSDTTGCWTGMKVTISDMQLLARTGDKTSIFPANLALPVCIVPQRQLLIEAPSNIVDIFENVTKTKSTGLSFGLHWGAQLYDAENAFDGDMLIRLSSGLQIHVPNDQFMVPFVTIDRNGSRIFNTSEREFLFGLTADQPATLGRYFLTSAYLMVNHDAGTFTMWQANPGIATQLVPVVAESAASGCTNVSGIVQPSASASSPAASASAANTVPTHEPSHAGAIAGAVVGSVAGLAAVGLLLFYVLRRRNSRMSAVSKGVTTTNSHEADKFITNAHQVHEMHQDWIPHAMQGSNVEDRAFELDGGIYGFHDNRD